MSTPFTPSTPSTRADLTTIVREKYGEAARHAAEGAKASCCGPVSACCGGSAFEGTPDPITSNLYVNGETSTLPSAAVLASLGCGNPTALAQLAAGEVVLDLGSGGGIDVLLSARRVGPTGKAYGLDMTDDMLALARRNAEDAGLTNVEFLQGQIEAIPLPDDSVDVIISNCVINLSADKRQVLREAFRVLKPGGRFAVSDVIVRGDTPPEVRKSMELWVGCVAGALEEQEFLSLLREVGFESPTIEPTRIYRGDDAAAFLAGTGLDADRVAKEIDGKFMSGFVRATKPHVNRKSNARSIAVPTALPPAGVMIRSAVAADLSAVEHLLSTAELPRVGVREALPNFFVASSNGALVAVAGLEICGENALLRSVAVAPEWRSRGLGRTLVARVIAEAEARGISALYLLTTTAEHYFPSFGFTEASRDSVPDDVQDTAEFRGACPASAVVMVRPTTAPRAKRLGCC